MFEINASVLTHAGKVRTNNEDSVSLVRPSDKSVMSSRGVLALIADGMGGHEGGEFASKLAVEGIVRSYYGSIATPPAALQDAFRDANRAIYRAAKKNPSLKGMGTTCVAVAVCDDQAWWAWVGDSRLYLLRDGTAYRMSEDHTVVQELVRRGLLPPEEACNHPDRSVLERAIGTRDRVETALGAQAIQLAPGDRLLLCSDGLHDLMDEAEIAECARAGPVADCTEALLHVALERGGFDNVSIILLEVKPELATHRRPPVITREHIVE